MTEWLALQGLDASDLEANRAGKLSERQRDRVVGYARRLRRVTQLVLATSAAITVPILAVAGGHLVPAIVIPVAFLLVLYGLIELFAFSAWIRAARSANVVATKGVIDLVYASPSRRALYVTLAGVGYNGLGLYELGAALTKGTRVRLYSLQPRGLIVAVEPL